MDSESEEYEPEYELESIVLHEPAETENTTKTNNDDDDVKNSTSNNNDNSHNQVKSIIEFQVWTVVPPPIEFMSALHANRQEISGRQVWCGSLVLAQYLLTTKVRQDQVLLSGSRVLELGCGTGLVGMMLASSSSSRFDPLCVALTDGDEEAVTLLKKNLIQNQIDPKIASAALLRWGENYESEMMSQFRDWCRMLWPTVWAKDGDDNDDDIKFDVILAGDVLYKEELPALFFATVDVFLSKSKSAQFILCHVPRSTVGHATVIDAAKAAGFHVEQTQLDGIQSSMNCPLEDLERARIYQITRRLIKN